MTTRPITAAAAPAPVAGAAAVPSLWRPAGCADGGVDPLPDRPRTSGGLVGAELMVRAVVPVWGQQLDITRLAAAAGLGQLLDSFSQIADALATLSSQIDHSPVTVAPVELDQALAADSPAQAALQALLGPSQRALAQRDAAVAQLLLCHDALQELHQLGRQAREVGEHTRPLAFRAPIDGQRGSQGQDAGPPAVADETGMLAARIAELGAQIERVVSRLDHALAPVRPRGAISDTTAEALRQELDLGARQALNGLLGAMGGAVRSAGDVQAAAATLGQQLEASLVHFQFGDRLSQMLDAVAQDMQNFARWVAAHPDATPRDAADWLAKLEASYTMEEQRAQHHGQVHSNRGSGIEFF